MGVFAGKPFPRATEAGVDFVQDKQSVVLVANPAQHGQEGGRGDVDAAAHLDGLDEDRADSLALEQAPNAGFDCFN